MRKKLIYILIASIAAVGAGAAVGTVLSGIIKGDISVSVSQAIRIEQPSVTNTDGTPWPHRWLGSVSDDRSNFTATAEAYPKETFQINVSISNLSTNALYVQLTLSNIASGITVAVDGSGSLKMPTGSVVQTGSNTWKFTLPAGAADGTPPAFDGIKIKVSLASSLSPGYYLLQGEIKAVEY